VGKHFTLTIAATSFTHARDTAKIAAETELDGPYVLRTPLPASDLDAPATVTAYKNLAHLERDFRHIKADDPDLRPIWHRLEDRVKAHVLICMLACYLIWRLRRAWAPLTFADEHPPNPRNPVAPAQRSPAAQAKASSQHDENGRPYRSFTGLLDHLAASGPGLAWWWPAAGAWAGPPGSARASARRQCSRSPASRRRAGRR